MDGVISPASMLRSRGRMANFFTVSQRLSLRFSSFTYPSMSCSVSAATTISSYVLPSSGPPLAQPTIASSSSEISIVT
jgi:hypothetical protein